MEIGERRLTVGADHRAIWLMERYQNTNGRLGVPLLFRIGGPLDRMALEGALADLADRHDALRTTYEWANRALVQVVAPVGGAPVAVEYTDLSGAGHRMEKRLDEELLAFLRRDFVLKKTAVHVGLWQLGPEDHFLVLNLHHIVVDAWSNALMIRDLAAFYNARTGGPAAELPDVDWQFSDHVERERILREARKSSTEEKPGGALALNPFAAGGASGGRRGGIAKHVWIDLDEQTTRELTAFASRNQTSMTAVLLAPFFTALADEAAAEDRSISVVFANRGRDEVQETVGRFTDMRSVRARAGAAIPVADVLDEVHGSVQTALLRVGDGTRSDDDDVVFHLLPVPPTAPAAERGFAALTVEPVRLPEGLGSRFRLQLLITPRGEALEAVIRYDCELYTTAYAERLAGRYTEGVRALLGSE